MSHLETLLLNEVRKPLEALEKSHVGFIDEESSTTIYYKIDERVFAIEVREVKVNKHDNLFSGKIEDCSRNV